MKNFIRNDALNILYTEILDTTYKLLRVLDTWILHVRQYRKLEL